jgi:hypothetical protein
MGASREVAPKVLSQLIGGIIGTGETVYIIADQNLRIPRLLSLGAP